MTVDSDMSASDLELLAVAIEHGFTNTNDYFTWLEIEQARNARLRLREVTNRSGEISHSQRQIPQPLPVRVAEGARSLAGVLLCGASLVAGFCAGHSSSSSSDGVRPRTSGFVPGHSTSPDGNGRSA